MKIGNDITIKLADDQFVRVLTEISSGYSISGIYNHTIGPNDSPKTAIKIISHITIRNPPIALSPLSNK